MTFVGAFQNEGRDRPVIAAEYPAPDADNPILARLALGFLSGSGDASFPTALMLSGDDPDIDDADLPAAGLFPRSPVEIPAGGRGIEDRAMGDPVQALDEKAVHATRAVRPASDRMRSVHANWIGLKTVSTRFCLPESLVPTRLSSGGPCWSMPHSEPVAAVGRAMFFAGVLRRAASPVGGTTTTRASPSECGETFAIRGVETEAREIVLTDGAPSETFVGNVSRRAVDNRAEFQAIHGDPPETRDPSLPRASDATHPPTLIKSGSGNGANAESAG